MAEETGGDEIANLARGQSPQRHDDGQNISNGERIESVEKGRGPDDDAGAHLPGGNGQPLDARRDLAREAIIARKHLIHECALPSAPI